MLDFRNPHFPSCYSGRGEPTAMGAISLGPQILSLPAFHLPGAEPPWVPPAPSPGLWTGEPSWIFTISCDTSFFPDSPGPCLASPDLSPPLPDFSSLFPTAHPQGSPKGILWHRCPCPPWNRSVVRVSERSLPGGQAFSWPLPWQHMQSLQETAANWIKICLWQTHFPRIRQTFTLAHPRGCPELPVPDG